MPEHLALLRGINVGGRNPVRMQELREAFADLGFANVSTYIASGNVLFSAPRQPLADLAAGLERDLTRRFGIELKCVVLTAAQLRRVVEEAPAGFGAESDRCDVMFVRRPLTAARAFAITECREGIDRAWQGPGVVYYARLAERASGSRLSKVVSTPEYKNLTIRSWSTTAKLHTLMGDRAG